MESQKWPPLEKTQNGNTYNVYKIIRMWVIIKMKMTLEYQYAHDIGRYECQMAKLEITYKPFALRLLSHLTHPQTP